MMRRTILFGAIFALSVVVGLAMGNRQADAHGASSFYISAEWTSDPDLWYGYLGSLNTSAAKARMMEGDNPWDSTSGAWLDFIDYGATQSAITYSSPCSSHGYNRVYFSRVETSGFAVTKRCVVGNDIESAAIGFDYRTWHTSSSTPNPAGTSDLRGVSTHEIGHAGGFTGHFNESSEEVCPSDDARQTMCETWAASWTWWARTLEEHDTHTFAAAY